MDKRLTIEHLAQDKAEAMLLARVYDKMTAAAQRSIPAATCFLSGREQMLARQLLQGWDVTFFGGTEAAERKICCHTPEYLDESWLTESDGPIAALRAAFYAPTALTHRDFLGALMGCGVKRETVGDIFVSEGSCDFLVIREILPWLLQNFDSAGRARLTLREIPLEDLTAPAARTKTIRDTVSSLRLDGVVASGFGLSRGKAALCIESGKTELNHLPCMKPDKQVAEGDAISVRGLGKMRLEEVTGTTKKGRIGILISRFV